jgi:glycoside hydrolase-like protein
MAGEQGIRGILTTSGSVFLRMRGMPMRRQVTFMIAAGLAVTGLTASSTAPSSSARTTSTQAHGAHASTAQAKSAGGKATGSKTVRPGPARPGNSKGVRFGGYAISVPAGWPVYSLTADPSRCVRFDRHAVYLGQPGASQQCPAHLVGRVATVTLTVGAAAPAGGSWRPAVSGQAGPVSLSQSQVRDGAALSVDEGGNQAQAVFGDRALTVTATYGSDAALTGQILRTVHPANAAGTAAATPVPPTGGTTAVRLTADARGSRSQKDSHADKHHKKHKKHKKKPVKGFDTCTAPSLQVMRKWRHAFSAAAIYIGGPEAACGWGNLSRSWVRSATRMGWSLMPTYVGRQAPCTRFSVRIHSGQARPEGRSAAKDAIRLARKLGIRHRGSPIYYDMEAYNGNRGSCRRQVLSFLDTWTRELHRHHYGSGVYSSASAAAEDLGRTSRVYGHKIAKPRTMWFGLWDGRANLNGVPYLRTAWWGGAHRIKQYRGGHQRKINGVKLNIDSDHVYGALYK